MMLPDDDDIDNDISSTATLERSRIERTNRAFDSLGRLGKATRKRWRLSGTNCGKLWPMRLLRCDIAVSATRGVTNR